MASLGGPDGAESQSGAQGVLEEITQYQDQIEQIILLLQHVDSLHLSSISRDGDLVADFQVIEGELGVVQTSGSFDSAQFEQELVEYGAHMPHTTGMLRRLTSEGVFEGSGDQELETAAQMVLEWQSATGQDIQGVNAGYHQ
ncbi:uncharacterized protein A1O5_07319 [Cladophialophora psammophila CBS 110553]|uniref:Uncharacterized protein n=1 Tax=Cladophialophora psammophila CBS 110553 TaxID=1182543 RepID=W9WN07_9EURO|nr:uncharacterized protein A1O5_07319 [Cladophialophora psammophila CBS 110553]EXJ69283.1 hypothetical protein A1O5_07319 [Cladophialophora psammophila CBS 110553]